MATLDELEARAGMVLQDHQREAAEDAAAQAASGRPPRLCLYHRTGAGKTLTALVCVALAGAEAVLVLAPPVTHDAWEALGDRLGVAVRAISHAKFRQRDFKVTRTQAMIVDEFHLLGGHGGVGWKKLDRIARGLQAPLIIASATPNYNDAERVYCIMHVLDPHSYKGGYLQFLYRECITRVNPFGAEPIVDGFHHYRDAEHYLSSQPRVHYVEDEAIKQVVIGDVHVPVSVPDEFELFGLDRRRGRLVASQMERRHAWKRLALIGDDGLIRPHVYDEIAERVGQAATPTLIFSASSEIAEALHNTAELHGAGSALVTGKTPKTIKSQQVRRFVRGGADILIGTATLATGLDGVDKMCDHLLIVDDTDDDALRRQLMGRILPRGLDTDLSSKVFTRLVYTP